MADKTNDGTVPVNIGKLGGGLKTMFYGMSEVFGAIGAGEEFAAAKKNAVVDGGSDNHNEAATENKPAKAVQEPKKEEPAVRQNAKTPVEAAGEEPAEVPETSGKPSITMDEIIQIVTKKIETDRKNSAKIGDIVKSFNIAKLTELPEDKYEAFLTQLTAL